MENFVIVWTIDGETMSIPHPNSGPGFDHHP
jgi:hypothetical protein